MHTVAQSSRKISRGVSQHNLMMQLSRVWHLSLLQPKRGHARPRPRSPHRRPRQARSPNEELRAARDPWYSRAFTEHARLTTSPPAGGSHEHAFHGGPACRGAHHNGSIDMHINGSMRIEEHWPAAYFAECVSSGSSGSDAYPGTRRRSRRWHCEISSWQRARRSWQRARIR